MQVCQAQPIRQGLPKLTKWRKLCLIMQEVSMQSQHTQLGVIGEKQVAEKEIQPPRTLSMQPH